jgi:membrane peptidoglycan carboxypeptidase
VNINELARYEWVHSPTEPDRGLLEHVSVGPGTPHWTSSSQIPLFVKAGAIVTEDRGFAQHKGVRWDLIAKALRLDLHKERFVYGGSTITQQLVKNLFLTREKTLSRKLEELVIAWQMERTFSKDEILTFYLNVIEYGPDIYGLRRAAAFYFGKAPAHLSPSEGAFLMGLKPYPRAGFRQWEHQRLSAWWVTRVKSVLTRMHSLQGAISADDVSDAAPYQVRFRAPGESLSSGQNRATARPAPPPSP